MDNKTHMMFHDEDIRAEGRKEGRAEGQTLASQPPRPKGRGL